MLRLSPLRSRLSLRRVLTTIGIVSIAVADLAAVGNRAYATDTAPPPTTPAPVILLGTSGVQWADVTERTAPQLAALGQSSAIGQLAVRGVRATACPIDGWLAISAGRRATDTMKSDTDEHLCAPIPRPEQGTALAAGTAAKAVSVPGWKTYQQTAQDGTFDARPGSFGDALAAQGHCVTAVGPGAAVASATTSGEVLQYFPNPTTPDALTAIRASECPLTVVDVGAIRDPQDRPDGSTEVNVAVADGDALTQLQVVDQRISAIVAAAPPNARVLVASIADAGNTPRLGLFVALGSGFPPSWVRTSSTRQDALGQTTDLSPTVLSLLGVPAPSALVGSPLLTVDAPESPALRLQRLLDLEQAAQRVQVAVPWFFSFTVLIQAVGYGIAGWTLHHAARGRRTTRLIRERRVRSWLRALALWGGSVPVACYLANIVPWWRADWSTLLVTTVTIAIAGVIAGLAARWPHQRGGPVMVIAGTTVVVLAVDVMSGSHLQLSSLLGVQPLVAGRFYGFSNVTFAIVGTAAIIATSLIADRWLTRGRRFAAAIVVAGLGGITTMIDAAPAWGSDFGGPLALIPAFALLTFAAAQVRMSFARIVVVWFGAVSTVLIVAVLDWLRPAGQRTHLGRFIQTLIDGGAGQVIIRKAEQNAGIVMSSPLTAIVPILVGLALWVVLRPATVGATSVTELYQRHPLMQAMGQALAVLWVIGFAVNDSGTAVPVAGGLIAAPLLIALVVRAPTTPTPE
ncbi:MAG: hypothetical protein ACRCTR_09190 [Actinomycetota bacterium]